MALVKVVKDFTQGDSFTIKISHNPVKDITGGSLVFVMKKRENDTTKVLSVTHTIGSNPLDDPTNGIGYYYTFFVFCGFTLSSKLNWNKK